MERKESNMAKFFQFHKAQAEEAAKAEDDKFAARFDAMFARMAKPSSVVTSNMMDVSPLSTQTTDDSTPSKRGTEETDDQHIDKHIDKKTKSGLAPNSPNHSPAGTQHNTPYPVTEETRGEPP
jgi:hypothetical protein